MKIMKNFYYVIYYYYYFCVYLFLFFLQNTKDIRFIFSYNIASKKIQNYEIIFCLRFSFYFNLFIIYGYLFFFTNYTNEGEMMKTKFVKKET